MKKLVSLALAIVLVISLSASACFAAAKYQLKIATVVSGDHAWVQMGDYLVKELSKRSNGDIEAKLFPGGQLGNDESTIDAMRMGTVDIVIGSTQNAAPFINELQALTLAYLFPNRDVFERVVNNKSEVFKYISRKYKENKLGLILLGIGNGGKRDLHTNKPINSVKDLKNIKMRTTSASTEALVWSALGTIPTSMSFNEIYSAVQSNTVSAFECTMASYENSALYEVAPYHINTAHQFNPTHITMSEISFNKLPKEYQELVKKVCDEATLLGVKVSDEADDNKLKGLVEKHGVKVCSPDVAEFKKLVEPVYPKILAMCKGQEFYELITKLMK